MNNYFMQPINLDVWPMFDKVKSIGHVECFIALSNMKKKDILFLHVGNQTSKYKSGIYAVGEVVSDPYILKDVKDKSLNGKHVVDVKIIKINYGKPILDHSNCIEYFNQFRTVHKMEMEKGVKLYNKIFKTNIDISYNKKRIDKKEDWIDILKAEKQEDNVILDILFYMMGCKNYTSNGENIKKALDLKGYPNLDIARFGKRIIELKHIDEQIGDTGDNRYWNIPFETVYSMNNSRLFTWKLRKELIDALIELYDFDNNEEIDTLFDEAIKEFDPDEYEESIKKYLKIQEDFVNRFNINKIISMDIDEYVIGKSQIDEKGYNSFCYLIERKLSGLGSMRGANASKFGLWYNLDDKKYKFAKKYGSSLDEVFNNVKKEICNLIAAATNDDFDKMSKSLLSPMFKGKILSTYFPDKYVPIFNEEDVEVFLNVLNITYDMHEVDTIEKKKLLLKEYKDSNPILNKYSDYYFMRILYYLFKRDVRDKHTVSGEIDYDIKVVDFNYLGNHVYEKIKSFRSRETDYERINRNKKDVGNRGEKAIVNYEKKFLIDNGRSDLAELVSLSENDAIGYDVISYNLDGSEKHIEVKTNSGKNNKILDFYLTANELETLESDPMYNIYYLYSIKSKPKLHVINKDIIEKNKKLYLKPVVYKVAIDVELKK